MAFTVLKTPPQYAFVENNPCFKIKTDTYIVAQGSKEIITIDTSLFHPVNGNTMVFDYMGDTRTYDFLTVVGNNDTDLPAYSASYSLLSWKLAVLDNLKGSTYITDNWIVADSTPTLTNPIITLTSKKNKDMQSSFTSYNTGISIVSGTDRIINEDLRILFKVLVDNKEEIEMSLPVEEDGTATFYVSAILKSFLYSGNNTILLPPINILNGITHLNLDLQKDYEVKFADMYDNVLYKYTSEGVCSVIRTAFSGGVSKKINNPNVMQFAGINPSYALLTHQPKKNKILSYYEPEFITFVSDITRSYIYIRLSIRNKNTGINEVHLIQSLPYVFRKKFTIPVGIQNLFPPSALSQLDNYDQFTVELYDQTTYNQTFVFYENTYRIECHNENNKYFVFENSLGGLDCIKLQGEIKESLKSKTKTAGRILSCGFNPKNGDSYVFNIQNQQEFKIKSEYFADLEYKKYLAELNYTKFLFELVYENNRNPDINKAKYIPLENKTSKIEIYQSAENSWRLKFNYKYLFTENSF